jgi:hypothetical protein
MIISNAEVEAGLSFGYKGDTGMSFHGIRNQTSMDCGTSHLPLLWTFPAIRMCQYESCFAFQRPPQLVTLIVRVFDVFLSTLVKVSQKVAKHLFHCLVEWQGWEIFIYGTLVVSWPKI